MKLFFKWKEFLLIWFIIFWLIPSYQIHNLLMISGPPPGSNVPSPPVWIPFGGAHFCEEIYHQWTTFSPGDAFSIFFFHMVPFIFYTFAISAVIYLGIIAVKALLKRD